MPSTRRLASSLLLGAGVFLVFAGINAALGYSFPGMVASVVAIAGLLYAGAVWFAPGQAPAERVLIFDHALRLPDGQPLLARFPEGLRDDVRAKATATLAGAKASLDVDGRTLLLTPLTSPSGAVLFGAVVESADHPAVRV